MTVTIHTISKDEWKTGDDYVICEHCGAHLRHYAKVDGSTYGLNCAKTLGFIGKKITAKKAQFIAWKVENFKRLVEEGKTDKAYSWARSVDLALGFNFPNSPDYVNQVFEAVS